MGDEFFQKKMSHNGEKTQRWDPLVSPGIVLRGKIGKTFFLFCSLGQMVQFDTIKFCRTCRSILVTSGVSKTSRERPKSALYLRLKKCKIFKICSLRFFMKNSQKSFTQRKPSALGKRFRSSDIAAGTNANTCFRTSASSSVKRNILRK